MLSTSQYIDSRTCTDCVELQTNQWTAQLNNLVDAYLEYRAHDSSNGMPAATPAAPVNGAASFMLADIELVDMFCTLFMLFCLCV